ncbi:hypothetical protein M4L90_12120 [Staphylococcus equorum]|uniref:Uncharacterized protein n=1 Tax=Staphylococcus equorum TaxID=246432 RepID=A0A9X4L565_9STAP|nr:hypothetical protein [Staphylococcus equorum]MDG0820665.1 hypothetical protein [Staphylococcus equorum]MDG0841290.1 hypothetical protein [Staphylococcus equorum]MDG0846990.1 hypothetical protein [Staphylococcus equorum]OEL08297.1 hypothetical protein AST04_08915 [Staphylococcus equorum]PTE82267.1 hypothetical protein BUY85_00590 [Staphylococcus equorum]
MTKKIYNLEEKRTQRPVLVVTDDKYRFVYDVIKIFKRRLHAIYSDKTKRFVDENEFFEEIDLLKKVKDNIVLAEKNNPRAVSDIMRLLETIADMLDMKIEVADIKQT